MKGTVKWFDLHKGYGFIVAEDGSEIYVHSKGIEHGRTYVGLNANDTIEFETAEGKKGPQAVNVTLVREEKPEAVNVALVRE